MSASKNLGKVFMTPKGIWDKNSNYTKLDIVTNKVGKISCGYIATTDIEKNIEITDNRWLKLFELLDGDLTEEYKAVQMDVANKATDVDANKKAVDLIYSQMQKLYDVEISTTTPTNERTGLWINPDDISGVINIPEIKDDEVSDVDTWSSKKIDNVTGSLKEDISTKITKFYASSQGKTHLADSDNGKIMDMMLYGKSEQKQYSGKNLLNATLQTTTQNGVTCINNGDGTYTLNGTATDIAIFVVYYNFADVYGSASSLKMVGCPSGGSAQKYFLRSYRKGGNPEILDEYGSGISIGSFKEAESNIAILVKSGVTVNNLIFKPMLTTDTTATYADFEPYTGGIPSPNPDYPQEIKSVVNPTVKVCGKNLLNYDAWSQTNCANGKAVYENNGVTITALSNDAFTNFDMLEFPTTARIPVNVGETITISWDEPLNKEGRVYVFGNASTSNMTYVNNSSSKQLKYTIPSGVTFITFRFGVGNAGDTISYRNIQIELGSTPTAYEPYHEQTVTLPYTLNAIPVSSGGNVTIDGQQYIADYVDVEREKLVRMVDDVEAKNYTWDLYPGGNNMPRRFGMNDTIRFNMPADIRIMSSHFKQIAANTRTDLSTWFQTYYIAITDMNEKWKNSEALIQWFSENNVHFYLPLKTPTEIDLTPEEIAAFKTLVTYYPTTNISVNSEQLDGYTVFNYPISMANGWNYVKKQLNDNRDYIYDMDIQSAEAYVNSEYAVALTELEV